MYIGVQFACLDGSDRIVGLVWLPGSGIPDDHVPAAVFACRDDALEIDVLDGMIFDVHGRALGFRVEGWPVGHGPARQHAVHLKPQVVVPSTGTVPLHDEPERVAFWWLGSLPGRLGRFPGRLGRAGEVALRLIGGQLLLGRRVSRWRARPRFPRRLPGFRARLFAALAVADPSHIADVPTTA